MRRIYDDERQLAYLDGDSHLSEWVKSAGKVDAVNDSICQHNCEHMLPGHWVIDAGAALGNHTSSYLKKVGPSGRVLSFEPNPDYFDCLKYNCPEASCYRLALWDQSGLQKLSQIRQGNVGACFITDGGDGVMVKTMALDDMKIPRLDFLKMDIEGAELMAMKGSIETIKRLRPLIQCEVFPQALARSGGSEDELYALLAYLDYGVVHIFSDGNPVKEILATPK